MTIRGEKCYHVKMRFLELAATNVDEVIRGKMQPTHFGDYDQRPGIAD